MNRRKALQTRDKNSVVGLQESKDTGLEKERARSKKTSRKVGVCLKVKKGVEQRGGRGSRLTGWGSTKLKVSLFPTMTGRNQC